MQSLSPAEVREFTELAQQVLSAGPPPTFEYLPVASVRVEMEYQRDLKAWKVARMVREYDVHRLQPIEVSRRADGTLWCIEGQHRLTTARQLGMHVIGAMVHVGLTQADEAILFWLFQRDRTALSVWDSFKARLIGHEPHAIAVDETVMAADLTYGRDSGRDINALAVLEGIERVGGKTLLLDTLMTIKTIWPIASHRFDGPVISGVATILRQYGTLPVFNRDRMLAVLSTIPPSALIAEARQSRSVTNTSTTRVNYAMAITMRDAYNRRLGRARQLPPLRSMAGRSLPTI